MLSNCCNAEIVMTDICSMCKEHCEPQGATTYLGDGVYAQYDGRNVILTTEDGINITNTIVLEPAVVISLQRFLEREAI